MSSKIKSPYPAVTPKLSGGYPSLAGRRPGQPNTDPASKPKPKPLELRQPPLPRLTTYPALRPLHAPGASGSLSEPIRDPQKTPKFRVGQSVTYSVQGSTYAGAISGWARDDHANNWYEFAPSGGGNKIWLPEAAFKTKQLKAFKMFVGRETTITYKGVKVKGVITSVDSQYGRPVMRVKVATTVKSATTKDGDFKYKYGDQVQINYSRWRGQVGKVTNRQKRGQGNYYEVLYYDTAEHMRTGGHAAKKVWLYEQQIDPHTGYVKSISIKGGEANSDDFIKYVRSLKQVFDIIQIQGVQGFFISYKGNKSAALQKPDVLRVLGLDKENDKEVAFREMNYTMPDGRRVRGVGMYFIRNRPMFTME